MNRVIALAWAVEPLAFKVFFPPQVTVPVGAAALPLVIAELAGAPLVIAEVAAELLGPAELLGAAELADAGAAAGALAAALVVLLLDAVPLLSLPQADRSNPAATTRLTAAAADRLSFT